MKLSQQVNHLKKHMHSHDLNLHTCPYCQAYFKKPFNLKEHIKKHQSESPSPPS